jgi:hypothetical protein
MALPLFIRRLIAPVEVKLVLSALSEEVKRIDNAAITTTTIHPSIATNIITSRAVDDILRYANQIKGDIQNGRSPRILALFFMMKVARDYLASGKFAIWAGIYRGMNSLSMQGQAIYGLNAYCLDELTKLGEFTQEQKAAALKATKEEIRIMG